MAEIALFHSVLGVRPGVLDAARRLTEAGHEVLVADLYDGEVFDGYEPAMHFAQEVVGFPELLARAHRATRDLADGLFVIGFSMGAAPAEYVACAAARGWGGAARRGAAADCAARRSGLAGWKTPVQLHCMRDDPWREPDELEEFSASVSAAGAGLELFDYEGDGHLFTDASLTEEYDEAATELFWQRVQAFCAER